MRDFSAIRPVDFVLWHVLEEGGASLNPEVFDILAPPRPRLVGALKTERSTKPC